MDRLRTMILAVALCAGGGALAQPVPAGTYRIDPAASSIYWQVYKAGALARFGHNHVISAAGYDGTVTVAAKAPDSGFELTLPVTALVVDDPAIRAQKGEDFASEPSDDDIAGTRSNMLGEDVLNAEMFPALEIAGRRLSAFGADATIDVSIGLLGRRVELTLPVSVEADGEALVASGEFTLQHEDLGMQPFSVMMGALQVGERLDFFYRIVARKAD